jgi:hypothetical protein
MCTPSRPREDYKFTTRLRRRPQWLAAEHSHKLDTTGVRAQGFKDIVSHWQLCQSVGATLEILPSAIGFIFAVLGNARSARHLSCCELLQVYWCQKKINAFIIVGLLFYLFSTLVHQLRRTIQLPEANMYIHLLTRAVREARRPLLEGALSMGRSTIAM